MSFSLSPLHPHGIAKAGYSTEIPTGYYVSKTRYGWMASLDGYGQIGGEGADESDYFDSYATAAWACQDHALVAAEEERQQIEAAADDAGIDAVSAVVRSARDLLDALDRGHLGNVYTFDGHESAYVADLRVKLAKVA